MPEWLTTPLNQRQARLLLLGGVFLTLFSVALTLAPAIRSRSWEADLDWGHWLVWAIWLVAAIGLHLASSRWLPLRDPLILPIALTLTGWGMLTIERLLPGFGLRQGIWLALAGVVISLLLRWGNFPAWLKRYKYLWLVSGLLLTAATLFFGVNPLGEGARLWLGLGGLYLQPSEPLKLLLTIYLAAYLGERAHMPFGDRAWQRTLLLPVLAPSLLLGAIALGILAAQRDLGAAAIFILIYTVMFVLATRQVAWLGLSAALLLAAGSLGALLFDLVRVRIEAWLNPWLDPTGRSFQIVQSLISVANGGLLGRGPGLGSPGLVPVAHSDFIFTAILEETGLIGGIGLLILLAILVQRGMHIALRAPDSFSRLLAAGLTASLAGQAVLIMGGNLRLLPLTGVTLPFLSYGGSSLLTTLVIVAILLHLSQQVQTTPEAASAVSPLPAYILTWTLWAGLAAVALVTSWWAIIRSDDLLARTDNPRRALADRSVLRGALLDRDLNVIQSSLGEPGNLQRQYNIPALGPVVGYAHPVYGLSGLEESLDAYLRGLSGRPAMDVTIDQLLYGQSPPGLDVRLSLDLELQAAADAGLDSQRGALALVDARSGEILALSSHPGFDPNQLEQIWDQLIDDAGAPLINRATQSAFQPGAALAPFWLAGQLASAPRLPDVPSSQAVRLASGALLTCTEITPDADWASMIQAGCPRTAISLSETINLSSNQPMQSVLADFGLYTAPQMRLRVIPASVIDEQADAQSVAIGQAELRVSPLQMALAASALSNNGLLPAPRLAVAVDTPQSGWVILPLDTQATQAVPEQAAQRTIQVIQPDADATTWLVIAHAYDGTRIITWAIGGSTPAWEGAPLGLALLIEGNQPELARQLALEVLLQAQGQRP